MRRMKSVLPDGLPIWTFGRLSPTSVHFSRRSISHGFETTQRSAPGMRPVSDAVPKHREEVRKRTEDRVERTRKAVTTRLESEIRHWDHRANQLKEQELAGKKPRLNSARARARADDLQDRLKTRLLELDRELQIAAGPPRTVGGALVVRVCWSASVASENSAPTTPKETKRVERAAVDAVLKIEKDLDRDPHEMPPNNKGYDIEAKGSDGDLLFIEVKGRIEGAETVTVTRSEIGVGLNKPDSFVLALAIVPTNGGEPDVRYLRRPFDGMGDPHFARITLGVTERNSRGPCLLSPATAIGTRKH